MKILTGGIELERFTAADTQALYEIRNHESVRAFMANPAPLAFEAHCEWTRAHLREGGDVLLFMIRVGGAPRGFSLLKRLSPELAEIGLMVRDPGRHAVIASIAAVATVHCAFERLAYEALVSWVVPAHDRAFSINRSFGGEEVPSAKPGMVQYRVTRAECLDNASYRKLRARLAARLEGATG
jgi:RimJ/RimL family protein N-acetyltransferase